MKLLRSTHLTILFGGNPEFPFEKLHTIIDELILTLNTEKTHLVNAEDGFDFLGFHFVRHYSQRRRKRVTKWFPSPKSQKRIREKILNLTNNRARSLMTPEYARDILIPVLRGWGNYFSHSLASNIFNEIWEYAQCRLMYMYCHQHNIPRKWKNRDIPENLSIMQTKTHIFLGKRHNTMS